MNRSHARSAFAAAVLAALATLMLTTAGATAAARHSVRAQVPLANAEAFGASFANEVGCSDQTAACLRHVPVSTLVGDFPTAAIPGVVDGKVLTESIEAALAAGRFAHVPLLDGVNQNEELIFVAGFGLAVSGGTFVPAPAPGPAISESDYEGEIASVLGVSAARASAVATRYPLSAFPLPVLALSTSLSDANFVCPAVEVDSLVSGKVPTFAYEFDDGTAPPIFTGPFYPFATHSSEIQYLFDQPNAPFAAELNPAQETLASDMRRAWANFAASGDSRSTAVPWPAFNGTSDVLSLVEPQPQVDTTYAARHNRSFWAGG